MNSKKYSSKPLPQHCIKLFHRRWYLLARFPDKGFGTFSFDRTSRIEVLDKTFKVDEGFSSRGQWLIVQSPEWLACDIQQWMQQALARYSEGK